MEKLKELLARPLIAGVVGFVLGLIIGLPILGWGLFPVRWVEAAPEHLRQDVKEDYLRMAIQSYSLNKDGELASRRFQELGSDTKEIFAKVSADPALNPEDVMGFSSSVKALNVTALPGAVSATQVPAAVQTVQIAQPTLPGGSTAVPSTSKKGETSPFLLLGMFCLLTLVIGGALVYLLVFRKRGFAIKKPTSSVQGSAAREQSHGELSSEVQDAPIAHFVTTYTLGDDLYDDSFSVDSPTGEFLGECGVGISDTVGVGEPKKVTAFELWLFDKNDIQTVTKVMMSNHAFVDNATRQRLVSKGEPILINPNERIYLETASLQLEARVVEAVYGQSALPSKSYFDRMTLELAVWPK